MKLAVSRSSCRPLSAVAQLGGRCGGCFIQVHSGLEWHALPSVPGEPNRRVRLCPACHLSQHLDTAGQLDAGAMIWCPEIDQARLNMICNIMAGATAYFQSECKLIGADEFGSLDEDVEAKMDPGVHGRHLSLTRQIDHLLGIYQSMSSRSDSLVALTGFEPAFGAGLSNPAVFAQLMQETANKLSLTPAQVQARIEGVRFLPALRSIRAFGQNVRESVLSKYPMGKWHELLPKAVEADAEDVSKERVDA